MVLVLDAGVGIERVNVLVRLQVVLKGGRLERGAY
jgi:hypothetical protein